MPDAQKGTLKMRSTPWLAALALFAILCASQAEWIWISLYFQTQTAAQIVLAFAIYAFAIAAAAIGLTLAGGQRAARMLLHGAIAVLLCLALFNGLREAGYIQHAASPLLKIGAVAAAVLGACAAMWKMPQALWSRLYPAIIVACPIFTLVPWVIAHQSAPTLWWPAPGNQNVNAQPAALSKQNTIVLLLDELSANAAEPITSALRAQGMAVSATDLKPAGDDTVNVIPTIWAHRDFSRAAPCGPTQLCSNGNVLDFARVHASSPDIDVVAFYHQYCAMPGLRSCRFFAFPVKPAWQDLTCELLKKPHAGPFAYLGCAPSVEERAFFATQRAGLQQALAEAPFWQRGGILYGHLLQPHPLMGATENSLADEYRANIADSAQLVAGLARKAQERFGKDFRLIIFSDHPLRPQVWCTNAGFYREGRCQPEPGQLSDRVPLIVATATDAEAPAIESNEQVFDLLYKPLDSP